MNTSLNNERCVLNILKHIVTRLEFWVGDMNTSLNNVRCILNILKHIVTRLGFPSRNLKSRSLRFTPVSFGLFLFAVDFYNILK
jgi:hypothetical protein